VVNQTISRLACGKPIRGHVAFLGGPLHFLDQLKASFIRTLRLDDEHAITPENSHLFAAMGSALNAKAEASVSLTGLRDRMKESVQLEDLPVLIYEEGMEEKYKAFQAVRSSLLKALEDARSNGVIGSSSEAEVVYSGAKEAVAPYLNLDGESLRQAFNVASIRFVEGEESVSVKASDRPSCPRCRQKVEELEPCGEDCLCHRCAHALGEDHD
jgi:activator of 2-hydroxyglutaryl-CoA dehydratase